MKRFCIHWILFILLAPVYTHAGIAQGKINESVLKNNAKENTFFKANVLHAGVEIVNYHFYHNHVSKTNHGFQRQAGYLSATEKRISISSLYFSLEAFTIAELFGNSYLSHIYPSHNFW